MNLLVVAAAGLSPLLAAIYMAPALLAHARHLPGARTVLAVNLFLGWTVLGWVFALTLATGKGAVPGQLRSREQHARPGQADPPLPAPHAPPRSPARERSISVWHTLN